MSSYAARLDVARNVTPCGPCSSGCDTHGSSWRREWEKPAPFQQPRPGYSSLPKRIAALLSFTAASIPDEKRSLASLPTEIIQYIANYLPLDSRAVLALTNRTLCFHVGTESWKELKIPSQKVLRMEFLELLERDVPHLWLCRTCQNLHRKTIKPQQDFHPRGLDRFCNGFYCLSFSQVHLALSRHKLGRPHGICLENLACRGSRRISETTILQYIMKLCIARNHNGVDELLLNAKYRFHGPKGWDPQSVIGDFLNLCPHQRLRDAEGAVARLIKCKSKHFENGNGLNCTKCIGLKQCSQCPSEYTASLAPDLSLRLEVWHNLGPGRNTSDLKWKAISSPIDKLEHRYFFWPGTVQASYRYPDVGRQDGGLVSRRSAGSAG